MPILHDEKTKLKISSPPGEAESPILEIDGLTFSYPDGWMALQNVSLKILRGEKVALVGPNGAGKSTLMLHLSGLLKGEGGIRVAGLGLNGDNLPQIRSRIGLVFQNPDDQLFSPTVYEDVAFGPLHMCLPEDEIHQRVTQALEQVSMSAYAHRLSHHLSMGEKKRIAIATVLSMQPELLVLDEPTAGLDPRARRSLIELLAELPISMLVTTHDLLMVRDLLPRMVILDGGRVTADGLTGELLKNTSLLANHGLELP